MIGQPSFSFTPSIPRAPGMQPQGGIKWVQGEAGANAAFVPFGQSDVFFDSNSDRFWIKTVDPNGRPFPLQPYRYMKEPEPMQPSANPLTREEVQEMINAALSGLRQKEDEAE